MTRKLLLVFALVSAVGSLDETRLARAQTNNSGDAVAPIAALTNSSVTVKSTRGVLQRLLCYNPNASVQFVQVYDTSAAVTPGVTAAKTFVPLAASTVTDVSLSINMFSAIKIAGTTTSGGGSAPGSALPCSVTFQ